jgi:hypothetical protein
LSETTSTDGQNTGTESTGAAAPPANTPAQQNTNDLPEWAREKLTKANNEAAGYRVKARDLGTENDALKAQVQTLTDEKTAALDGQGAVKLELFKLQTALSVGVPGEHAADFAELLKGDTADEIKAAAEKAKQFLGNGRRPSATDPSQGQGSNQSATPADEFHGFVLGQLGR